MLCFLVFFYYVFAFFCLVIDLTVVFIWLLVFLYFIRVFSSDCYLQFGLFLCKYSFSLFYILSRYDLPISLSFSFLLYN